MIETEQLLIKPLDYEQLIKYLKNDNSLDEEFELQPSIRTISTELMEALNNTILPNVKDINKNYLFSTLWTIILKEKNRMIGDLCFVGEPNSDGEIEIGYGTYLEFRSRGYMTEAVGGMIKWAKDQQNIKSVIASTEKTNIASSLVLEKNNFTKSGETELMYIWKLDLEGQNIY